MEVKEIYMKNKFEMRWVGLAVELLRLEHSKLENKISKLSRKSYNKVATQIEDLRETQNKLMEAISELYKIKEEKESEDEDTNN